MTRQGPFQPRTIRAFLVLVGLLLTAAAAGAQSVQAGDQIVIQARPCLDLRSAPDGEADGLACLPLGQRVRLLETREGWGRVRSADGREGWLPLSGVEPPGESAPERERIAELERELTAAAAGRAEAQRRIAALEEDLAAAGMARARLEGERTGLEAAAADARREVESLTGRLRAAERFLAASEKQRLELAAELAALRDQLAARPEPARAPAAAQAAAPDEEPPADGASTDEPAVAAPGPLDRVPEPAEAGPSAAIMTTINGWAEAWSQQRVEEYLAFYAEAFEPPDGQSRAAWEAMRRQRLLAPSYINVGAALVDLRLPAPDRAEVELLQSYRSDRFEDMVVKTLELALESGRWKIVREIVE